MTPPAPGCWLRATTLAADPSTLRDGIAAFQSTVIRGLRGQDGFCGAMLIVDRATGIGIGSTMWSSHGALVASRAASAPLRASATADARGQVLGVAEYEVLAADIQPPRYEHLFRARR